MNTYIILRGIYNPLVRVWSVWLATLTIQGRELWSYPVSKRLPTFGLMTLSLFWWRFALVTFGRSSLTKLFENDSVENSLGSNWIPRLFYEEIGSRIRDGIYQTKWRAVANTKSPARTRPENIYVKEEIQDVQYLHGSRIIYSFNKFFNTLRKRKWMNCIIMFLVWISLQQRMIWKNLIVPWIFDSTMTKSSFTSYWSD